MKELFKTLLVIIIFAIIIVFVVIIFPRNIYLSGQVDNSLLLQYARWGWMWDVEIKIFKDASVENNWVKSKLSDIDFKTLTQLIEKKEYSLERQSLFKKWKAKRELPIFDSMYISYFINRKWKLVKIYENDNILNIIKNIQESSEIIETKQESGTGTNIDENTFGQTDDSLLLKYNRYGWIAWFYDVIKIFKDASVENNWVKSKLSDIDFKRLTQIINKKKYSVFEKGNTNEDKKMISDWIHIYYYINISWKLVEIYEKDNVSNIIKNIQKSSKINKTK